VYWKALDEWDFLGGNFIIFKPKVKEMLNFELFSSLKIKVWTLKSLLILIYTKRIFNEKKWSKIENFEIIQQKLTKVLN